MDRTMRASGRRLNPAALSELQAAGQLFLECYGALSKEAIDKSETTWKLIPKMHQVTHMLYQHAPQANPRRTHNYADEDLAWDLSLFTIMFQRQAQMELIHDDAWP